MVVGNSDKQESCNNDINLIKKIFDKRNKLEANRDHQNKKKTVCLLPNEKRDKFLAEILLIKFSLISKALQKLQSNTR
jgi:hypothetical protein